MPAATIEEIKTGADLNRLVGLALTIDKVIVPIRSGDEPQALQHPTEIRHLIIPCNEHGNYEDTAAHQVLAAVERVDVLPKGTLGEYLYSQKENDQADNVLSYHFPILYVRGSEPTHLGRHVVADTVSTLCRNAAEGDIAILLEANRNMSFHWVNAIREGAERSRRVVYFYAAK